MNKAVLLILLALIAFPVNGFARDVSATRWELSGHVGAAIPTDEDADSAMYYGGRLTFDVAPNVAIGGEIGWAGWDDDENGVKYGELQAIPILADLVLELPLEGTDNRVVPYAIGGLGVVIWDYDESALLTSNGISVDGDTAFAAKAGGGVDFYVTDTVAIFAEGSYLWSDYDAQVSAAGVVASAEVDTDVVYVGGGIKAAF